ncbi:hypothetical protein BDU57DRAFT_437054 [Ampelomyces quisqualis]|uniref:CFEM domain-containing protein n=1 Tax=Ampelomyces quisqualis TaxID=50730 RepID=A0A6A5R0L7_AMPQU|nr:hypothetical protein BDU57DRAFT_437054 [Ampelomyces quisqualis]
MKTTYAVLAGLAAQQAAATWSFSVSPYMSPQYANNECSDKQKGGFDWSDLEDGESNFQYGDFDFSKDWKCSNSFGKRDHLTKRTFGNKAIINKCTKEKPATFGCDKKKDGFSITTIDVSADFDVELDLHYTMTDGSLCKQKSVPCKKEGSTIQNTQCGGAKSVDVYLGSRYKGDESECEIGFHHIGFDCDESRPYNPPAPPQIPSSSPVVSEPVSTPPVVASSPVPCNGDECDEQPQSTPVVSTSVASTPVASTPAASIPGSCNEGYGEGCPPVQTPPVENPPSSTRTPSPESSIVMPPPPSNESSAAPCDGGYGEACGASSVISTPPATTPGAPGPSSPPQSAGTPVPETSSAPPSQPSSPVYPPSSFPPKEVGDVLPTCMNTWLQISTEDCKDNTAADCYCKNAKFTKNVIECVQARCDTDQQTKDTLQYLVGICAQYVPENPGLVTDCPEDTFEPTPSTPQVPSGDASAPGTPVTTAVPDAPPAPSKPVTTIVYGSTSLTVPQVHFTTEVPEAGTTPTAPVNLAPGVPPQAPANPTPVPAPAPAPYPIPSTLTASTLPTGTGGGRPTAPAEFTGAASPFKADAKHVMLGAALVFFAL